MNYPFMNEQEIAAWVANCGPTTAASRKDKR